MTHIRKAQPADEDALYHIALLTGDHGKDATALYVDPKMKGHIFAVPYLRFSPELAFVAEMNGTVVGYCVGVADTREFENRLEQDWWPVLQAKYPAPNPANKANWTLDEQRIARFHAPEQNPETIVTPYPAHLHMNLLPQAQGLGIGVKLLAHWMNQASKLGVKKVHLSVSGENDSAIGFWHSQGFEDKLIEKDGGRWMGKEL